MPIDLKLWLELSQWLWKLCLLIRSYFSVVEKPSEVQSKILRWGKWKKESFPTFPVCFLIPIFSSNLNSNLSDLLDTRHLQEQVRKAFYYQKFFWPFTVWINCSGDLKKFANSRPSASNFKSFSRSLEQFFLTVGQNNFGNKIPFLCFRI